MTAPTPDPDPAFRPFADADGVRTLGALTFENGTDRIVLHGSCEITRDRAGLALARALQRTAAAILAALEAQDLPETGADARAGDGPAARATARVRNPFA